MFPPGSTLKAGVIEIDNQGRLRLSKNAAEKAEERRDYDQFMRGQKQAPGKGFGTLGDLLKGLKK
jgi:small subunit ribosomal protein S1